MGVVNGRNGADGVVLHERNAHHCDHRDRSGIWCCSPNAEKEGNNVISYVKIMEEEKKRTGWSWP
jgi:hypothetical protein